MHNIASTRAISYRALLPSAQCSKTFNFDLVVSSTIEYMPSDLLEERAESLCSLRAIARIFSPLPTLRTYIATTRLLIVSGYGLVAHSAHGHVQIAIEADRELDVVYKYCRCGCDI